MLWPKTLTLRLILLMLATLALVQCVSVLIYLQDRNKIINTASASLMVEQIGALVRLVDQSEPSHYNAILSATQNSQLALRLSQEPIVTGSETRGDAAMLQTRLYSSTGRSQSESIRVSYDAEPLPEDCDMTLYIPPDQHTAVPFTSRKEHSYWQWNYAGPSQFEAYPGPRPFELTVAVLLDTGDWLNIRAGTVEELSVWDWRSVSGLMLVALVVIGLMLWMLRNHTRPLQKLADTANQISRGIDSPPLKEEGSAELSSTIRAFNRMQAKQQRFIKDRILMLAAISHDLRTPLTKLRLQSEFVSDEDIQAQQLKTLNEMEAMLTATMNFARDEVTNEKSRPTDLSSLIQSLADDLNAGSRLTLTLPERLVFTGKPLGLRRMFSNVLENALKYASNATVSLSCSEGQIRFRVSDDGPGIPDTLHEQVFTPFYRIETSRNRETGGMGLGLSVVRSIALLHGGEVTLGQSESGGLLLEVQLPDAD